MSNPSERNTKARPHYRRAAGIFTGMIALGPTHQEADLWAVSAFVRQLPEMSPERYHELVTSYQARRAAANAATAHGH